MERAGTKAVSAKTGRAVLSPHFILAQTFAVGSLHLRFYSVFFVAAIILGYALAYYRGRKEGIEGSTLDDIFFWLIVNSFIAARAYYVIFYFSEYRGNLPEIYKVWHGGLAIYGALIGGALTLLYFARRKRIALFRLTDVVVFGLPLAQALGRLGNYFNYEAFGRPTNLPWKMYVPPQFRPAGYGQYQYFHPTFLYEMLWNIAVFIVLAAVFRKRPRPGVVTAVYLLLYSFGRFLIEGIRLDSAFFGSFRGDQITALFVILAALVIMRRAYASQNP